MPETPRFSERQSVEEVLYDWGGSSVRKKSGRLQALELLGLSEHVKKPAASLSAGLSKRLAWAVALSREGVEGFLLDEPVSSLDSTWQEKILFFIGRELSQGRFAIIASHDSAKYFDLCSQQAQIQNGALLPLKNLETPGSTLAKGDMSHVFAIETRGLKKEDLAEMAGAYGLKPWTDLKEHPAGCKILFSDYGTSSAWLSRLLACGVVVTQFDERLEETRLSSDSPTI